MQFEDFVHEVDTAIRASAAIDRFELPQANEARWQTRARNAAIALVPPRNVSVTLTGTSEAPGTRWYPIDAALVAVVSKRIAAYLGEA
jgi:hypothetical protein